MRTHELIRGQRFGRFEGRVEGILFEEGYYLFRIERYPWLVPLSILVVLGGFYTMISAVHL